MPKQNTETSTNNNWSSVLEIIKVGIPILTLVLGYFIYAAQARLQSGIDGNGKILADRLAYQSAVKEEFYKHRLDAYEKACKEMAATLSAIDNASATTENQTQAFAAIAKFDEVNKDYPFYWSNSLQRNLDDFWGLGLAKLQEPGSDNSNPAHNINHMVGLIHTQMKADLNVGDQATLFSQDK